MLIRAYHASVRVSGRKKFRAMQGTASDRGGTLPPVPAQHPRSGRKKFRATPDTSSDRCRPCLPRICEAGGGCFARRHAHLVIAQPVAALPLAETAGDVIFGAAFFGVGENRFGGVKFDQISFVKETGIIGTTRGLLHIMGDHDDAEIPF